MPHPRDKPHARIYREWVELPAWTSLPAVSRVLLIELMVRYSPNSANAFEVSDQSAAFLARCARGTARKALETLEDSGWIKCIRVGRMIGPKAKRAAVYRLTFKAADAGTPATNDFLRWRPHPVQRIKPAHSTDQVRPVNSSIQCRFLP
jgi:hypothetical protein